MKKDSISKISKIMGVFLAAFAGIKIASFGSLTGFAISSILQNSQFYIGYIFLFFLGITIFVSGDYLQEYLAAKEQESPSPSLEGEVQTEEDRVYFKKRSSRGLLDRILGRIKVSRVQQDPGKYATGSNYQEEMTEEQKKIFSEQARLRKYHVEDFSPEWQERREEELSENLKILKKKGLNHSDLIAVRAIYNRDYNIHGDRMYANPARPTIHFSLNGLVGDVGGGGGKKGGVTWTNADTVFLSPFEELVDRNRQNFYGGVPEDVFFAGYINIPKSAVFLNREKGETRKEFRKRVEDTIKKMGYRVLRSGLYGDNSDLRQEFRELMEKNGHDGGTIHYHTRFSTSEMPIRNLIVNGIDSTKNSLLWGGLQTI